MIEPLRGEVWDADLNPTKGREQQGKRPVLVVSMNEFNKGPADLVVVLPLTGTIRGIPWHVILQVPEGGTSKPSEILCDAVRSISKERLTKRRGKVSLKTMLLVEDRLRILMGL